MNGEKSFQTDRNIPNLLQLFIIFSYIGAIGFGGVLPAARHILVDKYQWLDDEEFTEYFTLAQFFPGPNIANVGVIYGQRVAGILGAMVSVLGLYFVPMIATICTGLFLAKYWSNQEVQQVMYAIMPVAAGLMVGTVFKLFKGMPQSMGSYSIFVLTFVLMVFSGLPLWIVLCICLVCAVIVRVMENKRKG